MACGCSHQRKNRLVSKQEHLLEATQVAQSYESEGGEYALAARHIAERLREDARQEGLKRSESLNPWHPIKEAVQLKHLGKLGEEAGELAAIVCRCVIQGVDEKHPVTNVPNRTALEDEIADVLANIDLVMQHFSLDHHEIGERAERKKKLLRTWHEMA